MSEVEVAPNELLGIPGYALNVTVPGDFELPVPSVPSGGFSRAGSVGLPVPDAAVWAHVDDAAVVRLAEADAGVPVPAWAPVGEASPGSRRATRNGPVTVAVREVRGAQPRSTGGWRRVFGRRTRA